MIDNLPRNVFSFLYLMWGGVRHRYVTFLTPKKMENEKKDLIALKADCEAVIWILSNKSFHYTGCLAKTYTSKDIIYFAASTALIYVHENVFELCGVPFNKELLPEDMNEDVLLKFYVDQPRNINLIRYLYTHYLSAAGTDSKISILNEMLFTQFKIQAKDIFDDLKLVSHYDAMDYAIALQDYKNPQKAEAFFKDLKMTLSRVFSEE